MNTYKYAALMMIAVAVMLPFASAATLSGPSPIPNPPKSSVTIVNPILCRGTTDLLPVNITNLGNVTNNITQMQNMQVVIGTATGLYPEGNGSASGGNLNPGKSTIVYLPVFVSSAAPSFMRTNLFFTFSYYDLYTDSETLNVTLTTESCSQPLSVGISPKVLTTGMLQNITVNVSNTGSANLTHISASIGIPGSFGTEMDNEPYEISSLAAHSSVHFTKSIYISNNNNASISIPLNVSATYYNGTNFNEFSEIMPVLSTGLINFTASSFSLSPTAPTPGSIFSISFVLTDTGTVGATNLEVTPILPQGFASFGTSTVFVGDISPAAQTPITVSIEASNAIKAGSYRIPIRVNYMNNLRQNLTAWANETIFISPATFSTSQYVAKRSAGNSSYSYATIILAIAVIVLLYLYIKERKAHRRSR
ncbi:MAG: hypothetical protein QXW10_03735 [Candidatus Micrarchaeaceae archaeon]